MNDQEINSALIEFKNEALNNFKNDNAITQNTAFVVQIHVDSLICVDTNSHSLILSDEQVMLINLKNSKINLHA